MSPKVPPPNGCKMAQPATTTLATSGLGRRRQAPSLKLLELLAQTSSNFPTESFRFTRHQAHTIVAIRRVLITVRAWVGGAGQARNVEPFLVVHQRARTCARQTRLLSISKTVAHLHFQPRATIGSQINTIQRLVVLAIKLGAVGGRHHLRQRPIRARIGPVRPMEQGWLRFRIATTISL